MDESAPGLPLANPLPISASSLPLPTGAATAAKQPALGTAGTPSSDVLTVQGAASMTALKVDGSAVTQPVSVSSLPLPAGAATETTLAAINTKIPASPAQEHTSAASPSSVQISNGTTFVAAQTTGGNADGDVNALTVLPYNKVYNGSSWSKQVSVPGALNNSGIGVAAAGLVANFDDVSPAATSENNYAPVRMSANRNLYSTIRDAAGNERGVNVTAGNALVVDNSAVTQPVSASSLPLPTGAATAAKQPALGTAGTPSSDVLTVQGATSMTALKTDGSATTQPVSAASLPLPTGAATSAAQTTGNSSLSSIDGKTPALGQALAAASVPVVLPAATITTLTPPAAITNYANETGGNLAAIKTDVDKIPSQGQALMAASTPVVIASNQSAVPVSGTFWQATQPVSGSVTIASQANPFSSNLPTNIASIAGTAPAMKAASTAAAAGDTSLVVALSPNSPGLVVGNVAAGATDSGAPVKVGGVYNTTKPTLTNGQRGDVQVTPNGSQEINLNTLLAGEDLTNNWLNVNTAQPLTSTLLGSGTRTATGNGTTISGVGKYKEAIVFLNCTAASGTAPILNVKLQSSSDGGTTWFDLPNAAFTQLTGTGSQAISIGAPTIAFGDTIRDVHTISGTTPSFTFSVTAVFK